MTDSAAALRELWALAGGYPAALQRISLTGTDPLLPTDFKIGTAASAVIGASALAAAEIWRARTGRDQSVSVDLRAAVAAFRSERYLRAAEQKDIHGRDPVFGFYQAGDGRWIQIHSNMPHHRDGAIKLLGCPNSRE
jgi:crotonobetainyl-CoA:carnitine CoA-transferase CaiB-like acyl-CoA transferase